jgi:hypothetical protein
VLLVSNAGFAQTPPFQRTDYATADAPRGIATADFNRDGAPDLALVNNGRKSVAIMMNETGAGRGFVQRYEIALGGGPFEVAAADLNNDGVADLVVANADLNTIDIVLGRVAGGFEAPEHLAAAGFPRGVTIADIDRNGAPDIVYTQYELNRVQILHGDNTGHFTARLPALPTGPRPQGVVVSEFIVCCRFDIAVANTGARYISVLRQDATGFQRVDVASPSALNVLTAADFNMDGHMDLAGVSTASNTMALFRDTGSGFASYGVFNTGASPRGIEAVDLNKDGRLDLVTANRNVDNLSVYLARPDNPGWFAAPYVQNAGNGSRDVVSADFNVDGYADLATANEYGDSVTVLASTAPAATGPFFEARSLGMTTTYTPFIAVGNFNGNAVPDVLRSDGVNLDGTTFVPLSSGVPARSVLAGAVGDVNADGKLDAVLVVLYADGTYPPPSRAELYLGNGAGGFKYSGAFGSFGNAYEAMAADLNKDGRADLVVGSSLFTSSGGRIDVLLATAAGFAQQPAINLPTIPRSIDIADLDRNGTLDLAVASAFSGAGVQLLPGDGSGAFTMGDLLAAPARSAVRVVDVNRDGILDIVSGGGDSVVVWLGSAGGTFGSPQSSGADSYVFAIGDFTGDGKPDVITNVSDGSIASSVLMRGTGTGTFGSPEPVNVSFHDAEVLDFDQDGRMDLVLANYWHTMVLFTRAARGPNLAPVALTVPGYTVPYDDQLEVGDCGETGGPSYDPNLDRLTYEWRDQRDRIVSTAPFLCIELPSGTHVFTLIVRDGHGGESSASQTITVTPFKESVVVIANNADPHGGWQLGPDATADSGVRAWHPDAGAAKITAVPASPTHYVDTWFLADPAQTYKLWVRLKAQNDSWANDSIFVQFEHGAIVNNTTRYVMDSTDGLDVNLEQCSGCGVSGWGWRDERWGATLNGTPVLLRFPVTGWQRMRILTREDGVSVDQIVLSAEKYLTVPPGPAKRDNTKLPPKP